MAAAFSEASAPPAPNTVEADYIIPEIDAETEARANAEQQNEIVALNETGGKWKLDVGDAFHKQWRQIRDALMTAVNEDDDQGLIDDDNLSVDSFTQFQEDKVFVVSLLGNTSSGKSYVAQHLFTDSQNDKTIHGPVCIDETEKKGATTANVNCYVDKSVKNNKTLVLDYEGEKGSAFPLLLYARRGFAHLTGSAEKARQRRQAVTDYFPKLAYILSDVVMLLGNDDFASTDYLTRCREFALKANDGVSQMPHRPLLIIIQNKSSLSQSVSSDIVTQKFFDIHGQEAQTLKLYFSDVKCFCLPHTEQLQRAKGGILDGREIFDGQMADLKALFTSVRERNSERMLTHAQWLYLLQRVLEIVQSGLSVSLHTLLSEIVAHDDDQAIQTAMRGFLFRYNKKSIHSPQWFVNCHQFAIRILAHCVAAKAYGQRELMSERIIHEQCEKSLQLLSTKLDEFQPCEALYTGKGRSSKHKDNEHPIYCYQHKGAHEGGHRTCQSVYGLTAWKEFWGWSSTDVWPGDFMSSKGNGENDGVLSENMVNDLSRKVRELMVAFQQDPRGIYRMFTDLFHDCRQSNPSEIFYRICFCAPKSIATPSPPNHAQRNSTLEQIRRRQRAILTAPIRIMTMRLFQPSDYPWSTCQTCSRELENAWDATQLTQLIDDFHFTASSQTVREQSECVICFHKERDFLFVPCGHRGFCEKCADTLLRENPICPICRKLITAKQRVHDV